MNLPPVSQGILKERACRDLFEKINRRPYCEKCQADRIQFAHFDKKYNDCYSNLLPGFSSETVKIPIDLLVVAEAHGGGREENFHPQCKLQIEIAHLAEYYLSEPLQKFHQEQVRELLMWLDANGKNWVFTDLIKCFVSSGPFAKKNKLKGADNRRVAIKHCKAYLDKQIETLKPKKVLCLGQTTARQYFQLEGTLQHGISRRINNDKSTLVFSIFPSRNTADLWVENRGWERIFARLNEE